jgi:hypothetical protein
MLKLDLDAAERFVASYPSAFWDGWTLVLFKPTRTGENKTKGMYRDGAWGIATRVEADSKGLYRFRVS